MNREETLEIMAVLRGAYPQFYRSTDKQEAKDIVALWESMFSQDDARLVAAAVKALIESDEKGFPPHIGAVKAKLRLLTEKDDLTEGEAWSLVSRALRNGCYGAAEEFAKLPPLVQKAVGDPSQLREWAMVDSQTVESVIASNFQRSYRRIAERDTAWRRLPPDVRALAESVQLKALPEADP